MTALINNCVPFLDDPDRSAKPTVTPAWSTTIAGSLGLPEDRRALQATPFLKQDWRITVGDVEALTDLEARIRKALKSGKACAPRLDRAFEVQGGGNLSVSLASSHPITAGTWFMVSVAGVWQAVEFRHVYFTAPDLWDIVLDPDQQLAGEPDVGLLAYPLIFGQLTVRNWPRLNGRVAQANLSLTEPVGTGQLANSDTCVLAALEADDVFSLCKDVITIGPAPCASANAAVITWTNVNQAGSYKVQRAPASAGPWTTVASGVVSGSYTVPRSATVAYYYRVVPVIGALEGEPSNVLLVVASGIEKVMRAVQERYFWATSGFLTWPLRASDSAVPGDYPADGFYTDAVGAQAATYTAAIATAFVTGGWLAQFAQGSTLEGIVNIAAIPLHDTTTLAVPSAGSINAGNWESKLLELAASACKLQHLLVGSVNAAVESWLGGGSAFKYDEVSQTFDNTNGFTQIVEAAKTAWGLAKYTSTSFFRLPDAFGPASYSDPILSNVFNIGCRAAVTSGITRAGDQYGWGVTYANIRGKQSVDLSADARGSCALFLSIESHYGDLGLGMLDRPVTSAGTLQGWNAAALVPGGIRFTPYLTGSNQLPKLPTGAGTLYNKANATASGVFWGALAYKSHDWQLVEAIALWTREPFDDFTNNP